LATGNPRRLTSLTVRSWPVLFWVMPHRQLSATFVTNSKTVVSMAVLTLNGLTCTNLAPPSPSPAVLMVLKSKATASLLNTSPAARIIVTARTVHREMRRIFYLLPFCVFWDLGAQSVCTVELSLARGRYSSRGQPGSSAADSRCYHRVPSFLSVG